MDSLLKTWEESEICRLSKNELPKGYEDWNDRRIEETYISV
jgi:hypothetical protein